VVVTGTRLNGTEWQPTANYCNQQRPQQSRPE